MQLTKLDRWLKERFIYETHIFTLRVPECGLPDGVSVEPVEQDKGGDYRHKLIVKDNKLAENVIVLLRKNQIMHATHVVEAKNWYNKHIAPKNGGSFTYRWIFRFFGLCLASYAGWGVFQLTQNAELMALVKSSIDELKAGL